MENGGVPEMWHVPQFDLKGSNYRTLREIVARTTFLFWGLWKFRSSKTGTFVEDPVTFSGRKQMTGSEIWWAGWPYCEFCVGM